MSRVQSSSGLSIYKPNNGKNDDHLYMNNVVYKEILAKEDNFPKETNLDGHIDNLNARLKRKYQDEIDDCDGDTVSLNHLFGQILKAFTDNDSGFEAKLGMLTAIDAILKVTTERASSMLNISVLEQLKSVVRNIYCEGQFKNYGYLSKISEIMNVAKKSGGLANSIFQFSVSNVPGHGDLDKIKRRLSHTDNCFNRKHFHWHTAHILFKQHRRNTFDIKINDGEIVSIDNLNFSKCKIVAINMKRLPDLELHKQLLELQSQECVQIILNHRICNHRCEIQKASLAKYLSSI